MAEKFLEYVIKNFPRGNERLERLLLEFKKKVDAYEHDEEEFSDCDEDELIQAADDMEIEYNRKRKCNSENENKTKIRRINQKYECSLCGKTYTRKDNLTRHIKTHSTRYVCTKCNLSYTRRENLLKHEKNCRWKTISQKGNKPEETCNRTPTSSTENQSKTFTCRHCRIPFDDYEALFQHVTTLHPLNIQSKGGDVPSKNQTGGEAQPDGNKTSETSFGSGVSKKQRKHFRKGALNESASQSTIVPEGEEKYDLLQFFANVRPDVEQQLETRKKELRDLKWYLNVRMEMERDLDDGKKETVIPHFRSKNYISLLNDDNEQNLNQAFQSMNRALEEFIHKGSNWIVRKVVSLEVKTVKYSPVRGSSYMELPPKIKLCKGVVNVQNDDQRCFLWSVLAALHPVDANPQRASHYLTYEHELDMKGIDYPVPLNQIAKFEKQNNLSINVFGYEEDQIFLCI